MVMNVTDVVITCCHDSCGISFAVPEWWNKGKRETHRTFWCPNGHQQSFPAESELERTRRERDRARQEIARVEQEAAEQVRRAERAEKEAKKLRKRAAAGTCPCCQRTFANMHVHMRKQHPTFVAEQVVPLKAVK